MFATSLAVALLASPEAQIGLLASPSYQVREAAQKHLVDGSSANLWRVKAGIGKAVNPEVRRRLTETAVQLAAKRRRDAAAYVDWYCGGMYPCIDALCYKEKTHSYEMSGWTRDIVCTYMPRVDWRTASSNPQYPSHHQFREATRLWTIDKVLDGVPMPVMYLIHMEMYRRDWLCLSWYNYAWVAPAWWPVPPAESMYGPYDPNRCSNHPEEQK